VIRCSLQNKVHQPPNRMRVISQRRRAAIRFRRDRCGLYDNLKVSNVLLSIYRAVYPRIYAPPAPCQNPQQSRIGSLTGSLDHPKCPAKSRRTSSSPSANQYCPLPESCLNVELSRSKNDLSKQLVDLKSELLALRVQKIAGGSAAKLTKMCVARNSASLMHC